MEVVRAHTVHSESSMRNVWCPNARVCVSVSSFLCFFLLVSAIESLWLIDDVPVLRCWRVWLHMLYPVARLLLANLEWWNSVSLLLTLFGFEARFDFSLIHRESSHRSGMRFKANSIVHMVNAVFHFNADGYITRRGYVFEYMVIFIRLWEKKGKCTLQILELSDHLCFFGIRKSYMYCNYISHSQYAVHWLYILSFI